MTKTREDVFIHLIDFPGNTKETVCPNEDGTYSIFINSRLSNDSQLKAYEHAMRHIESGDFEKNDVQLIEYQVRYGDTRSQAIPSVKYLAELKRLQTERKILKRKIKQDEERIRILQETFNIFEREENFFLYGNDL